MNEAIREKGGEKAMKETTMGKVIVPARIENLHDLYEVDQGTRAADAVRAIDVPDALVDTGASTLSVPTRFLTQLGLRLLPPRQARTAAGSVALQMYGTVRLTVPGRDFPCDVVEIPDDCPVLIGQIPLELLDFVVDPI